MTPITLDLPDEVAVRIAPIRQHLPQLLSFALDLIGYPGAGRPAPQSTYPVLSEALDFLSSAPSSTEIVDFKFSPTVQVRLERLLILQRERHLTPQELAELDSFQQINHLLILLKARSRATLNMAN